MLYKPALWRHGRVSDFRPGGLGLMPRQGVAISDSGIKSMSAEDVGPNIWKQHDNDDDFVLFDLILYIPTTLFQLNRDRSSWVEPVLS